ncbi:MAG: hypothetical protein N2449_01765 [Bacteroidales bacterium]|nr:hypothetical protein [Bacteroidales bacterium]
MKKVLSLFVGIFLLSGLTFGQLIDEKNVTVTMDLQPVLQLHMTTSDQIDFVFDEIKDYYGGIIKYAATILKVSSSVSWDLYAVGTSQNGQFWDQQVSYSNGGGANSINQIPLSALELRQYEPNQYDPTATGAQTDYSNPFAPAQTLAVGVNSIWYSATPYTTPGVDQKYIQGQFGTNAGEGAPGGSYLTAIAPAGTFSDYYFTIDYRILPGLPAIFPNAGLNDGTAEDIVTVNGPNTYAEPGVYTMNVKYILLEDQ